MKAPHFIHLSTVGSTNNYAAKMLDEGIVVDGTVILTDVQTNGKGQRGNSWISDPFNQLTVSYCYSTVVLSPENFAFFNKAVALGIKDGLDEYLHGATVIKWPNDLMVLDKKIGGILIEVHWSGSQLKGIIVGLGVNIKASYDLPKTAISIEDVNSVNLPNASELGLSIYEKLDGWVEEFRSGNLSKINQFYHKSLWRLGELQLVSVKDKELNGKILGVDSKGQLEFLVDGETIGRSFDIKEIKFKY